MGTNDTGRMSSPTGKAGRPNVLIIYTDQQRADTIAAMGNPVIRTPNMDRLVREGVAFEFATTPCPVCLAARWSLHSGQYTTRHRAYSNHHHEGPPGYSLPGLLRQAGYRVGLSGKNHSYLRPADMDFWEESPKARSLSGGPLPKGYHRLVEEPTMASALRERGRTEAAIRFIDETPEQPFFLWLSYENPHTPYETGEPFFSMYRDAPIPGPFVEPEGLESAGKPFRQWFHQHNNDRIIPFTPAQVKLMREVYYGMVTQIDAEIGLVLDHLDAAGRARETLVIFTSDHGDYQGDHGLVTKSPALYDCLVRVPLAVRWPGVVDAGRRDERFASHVDILPTVLAAAGVSTPPEAQGVDLLPFLRDRGQGGPIRAAAFAEYGILGQPYDARRLEREGLAEERFTNPGNPALSWEGNPVSLAGRIRMVRERDWKYVQEEGGTCELYDLRNDPHELVNLCGHPEHADLQRRLEGQLEAWKRGPE